MFYKVITVDDLDTINIAVVHALQELAIPHIQQAKYCDEALLNIRKAQIDKEPYDLLITDLSFRVDHRNEKIISGEELIRSVRKIQPEIKILVFSIEDKPHRVRNLIENEMVNGYILKGRNSMTELKKAIEIIGTSSQQFMSPEIAHVLCNKSALEIETYDIALLNSLAKGLTQEEIALRFKTDGIAPHGTSSIEKRINKLKIIFRASNNVHLIAIVKDLGLV